MVRHAFSKKIKKKNLKKVCNIIWTSLIFLITESDSLVVKHLTKKSEIAGSLPAQIQLLKNVQISQKYIANAPTINPEFCRKKLLVNTYSVRPLHTFLIYPNLSESFLTDFISNLNLLESITHNHSEQNLKI